MTKHEWRKAEKNLYLPKRKPEVIDVPTFQFITIKGAGNPNSEWFGEYIGLLYSMAYAIKMNLKKIAHPPEGYTDFTVYPLEGVWDISEEAKKNFTGKLNKDELVFKLMLRQPDFVSESFFQEMHELVKQKKPHQLLDEVRFEKITDGKSVQMLHLGSYDDEPATFAEMERFATEQALTRLSKVHREIYLSDFRKVPADKLKTVLRFGVA
ncbi:MAG: GyrI-like domain-containing protein [Bacteroidota bacterium]